MSRIALACVCTHGWQLEREEQARVVAERRNAFLESAAAHMASTVSALNAAVARLHADKAIMQDDLRRP